MNRRRFLLTSLAGVLVAPLAAEAQLTRKVPRIGYLIAETQASSSFASFRQGLRKYGYVEGQNIVVEYREAEGKFERLPVLATELVRLNVEIIVAAATPAAQAARQATATIPIVAVAMGDPVGDGLVASLARPGGNLTGTTFLGPQLVPKQLQLLKEAFPGISRVAILRHPAAFAESTMRELSKEAEAAARTVGLRLHFTNVASANELDSAFDRITSEHPDAVIVFPSVMLYAQRNRIVGLVAKHRLPSVFNNSLAVELGGLMGYGPDIPELVEYTASYVDKILKGAKPGDLPVEQPTKFELVVNVRTAKALGLTFPPSLLLRADQVIE